MGGLARQDGRARGREGPALTRPMTGPYAEAFILANTKRLAPPLVPEITLHLAEESRASLAEDRGGARRDERTAALLGVRLGRRSGAGALSPRRARPRPRKARARSRRGLGPLRHRGADGGRILRPGGGHRRAGACRHSSQRCGQRAIGRDDRRRPARKMLPAALALSSSAISSTSGRSPTAWRPSSRRRLPTARSSSSATQSAAIFRKHASRSRPNTSVPVTRDLEDAEIKRTAVWRL